MRERHLDLLYGTSYPGLAFIAADGAGDVYFSASAEIYEAPAASPNSPHPFVNQNQVSTPKGVFAAGPNDAIYVDQTTAQIDHASGTGTPVPLCDGGMTRPLGLAVDLPDGYYLVTDGNRILTCGGQFGQNAQLLLGDGGAGYANVRSGDPVTNAWFNQPTGLAYGGGIIYVADTGNGCVRALIPNAGTADVPAGSCSDGGVFGGEIPQGVAADDAGDVFVTTESGLWEIDGQGKVTSLAGSPSSSCPGVWKRPLGVALGPDGGLYVADQTAGTVWLYQP